MRHIHERRGSCRRLAESFVPAAAVTAHEIVEGWVRDYALALPAEGVPPGVLRALADRAAEAIRQAQEAERTRALGRAGT